MCMIHLTRSNLRRFALAGLAAGIVAVDSRAFADDTPDPAAWALFRKGRDLVSQGDWEAGCAKLAQSFARAPHASTALNLARCDEHRGAIATAWARHQQAIPLAERIEDASRRDELRSLAHDGLQKLEPRLPKLHVEQAAGLSALSVVDESGRVIPTAEDVVLDPGNHRLLARAPGFREKAFDVSMREGVVTELVIALEAVEEAPRAAVVPEPRVQPTRVPVATVEPKRSPGWLSPGLGALGVVLSGVAVGFAVDASSAYRTLYARCGSDLICNEDLSFDPAALNARKNVGLTAAVGFGTAALVALTSSVWLWLHRSQ
jgi:hypothetical protein